MVGHAVRVFKAPTHSRSISWKYCTRNYSSELLQLEHNLSISSGSVNRFGGLPTRGILRMLGIGISTFIYKIVGYMGHKLHVPKSWRVPWEVGGGGRSRCPTYRTHAVVAPVPIIARCVYMCMCEGLGLYFDGCRVEWRGISMCSRRSLITRAGLPGNERSQEPDYLPHVPPHGKS
jgi:hypothetical protein